MAFCHFLKVRLLLSTLISQKKGKKKKKNVGLSEWPEFESKFSLKWASRSKIDGNCLFGLSEFTGHWPNKKDAKTT